MPDKSQLQNVNRLLLTGIGLLSVVVFILDTYVPLGVSGGAVYVLLVMTTYWVKGRKITFGVGLLGTFFIVTGFALTISSEYIILSGVNHLMAIIVVWASVWFVNYYKASIDQLRKNYRVLFQAANDEILVYQLDADNRPRSFLEVNDTACHILGYPREELLQKSLYDITVDEPEELERHINDALKYEKIVYETRHSTKEGEIIPVELSVRSFTYDGQPTIISVGRDLRERRRLEQEILKVSEQERQRIGNDMHDDLGQLLSVAHLTTRMLGKKLRSKDMEEAKKVQEIADMIKMADERVRTLSHGLVPVNIKSNGLNGALQELAGSISSMYDIEIHYSCEDVLLDDHFSAVHMYRIAQEAINNAVKHANATTITVELFSSENYISMGIKDNGCGFSESTDKSNGVGLRTMNFRANMVGGNLKINSKIGQGTEIICEIPTTLSQIKNSNAQDKSEE